MWFVGCGFCLRVLIAGFDCCCYWVVCLCWWIGCYLLVGGHYIVVDVLAVLLLVYCWLVWYLG